MTPWLRKRKNVEAGREPLDDDVLPSRGKPVPQPPEGGRVPDTAGRHGEMAVETASGLKEVKEED